MTNKLLKTIALGAALFAGANAFAEGGIEKAVKPAKQENEVIATVALPFSYESERTEPENNGKLFFYNFLSDGTAYQIDKPTVKFAQRWFWDVDGNGKFGDAEQEAIKEGKLVYLSNTFNEKANAEQMKFLQGFNKNYSTTKTVTGKTWGVTGLDDADANGDGEVTSEEINKYYGLDKKIAEAKLLEETKSLEKEVSKEPTLPKEKVNPTYSLVTGANVNADLDKYNATLGLRVNPIKQIGIAGSINFTKAEDENISYQEFPKFKGVYGTEKINEKDRFAFGADLETSFGIPLKNDAVINFILGGGTRYWHSISEINEKIIRDNITLKENINSKTNNEFSGNVYGGVEAVGSKLGIGLIGGYDWKAGAFLGARAIIPLNKSKVKE